MIRLDDIKIRRNEQPDGKLRLDATVPALSHFSLIAPDEKNVPGLPEAISSRLKHAVWQKAYGDLVHPFQELQMFARANAPFRDADHVLKLCEQINVLLSPERHEPALTQ